MSEPAPLVEIERRVQQRAKDAALDVTSPTGAAALRSMVEDEVARWALDHKRVPHVRRAVTPPRHRAIAPRLNAGRTFPVLVLDGVAIGDSTRIIEALEHRYPEPPL